MSRYRFLHLSSNADPQSQKTSQRKHEEIIVFMAPHITLNPQLTCDFELAVHQKCLYSIHSDNLPTKTSEPICVDKEIWGVFLPGPGMLDVGRRFSGFIEQKTICHPLFQLRHMALD